MKGPHFIYLLTYLLHLYPVFLPERYPEWLAQVKVDQVISGTAASDTPLFLVLIHSLPTSVSPHSSPLPDPCTDLLVLGVIARLLVHGLKLLTAKWHVTFYDCHTRPCATRMLVAAAQDPCRIGLNFRKTATTHQYDQDQKPHDIFLLFPFEHALVPQCTRNCF